MVVVGCRDMLRPMVEPPDGLDHPQDGAGLPTVGGGTDDQDAYEQQELVLFR